MVDTMTALAILEDGSFLLVVDRDVELADRLATEGGSRGMRVEIAGDLAAAARRRQMWVPG